MVKALLVDLKGRGLAVPPKLAVGDGAPGFWKAMDEVFPGTHHQRCWFHKMSNVLNRFPKSMPPAVAVDLRESPTRKPALRHSRPSRPSRRNTAPDTSAERPA